MCSVYCEKYSTPRVVWSLIAIMQKKRKAIFVRTCSVMEMEKVNIRGCVRRMQELLKRIMCYFKCELPNVTGRLLAWGAARKKKAVFEWVWELCGLSLIRSSHGTLLFHFSSVRRSFHHSYKVFFFSLISFFFTFVSVSTILMSFALRCHPLLSFTLSFSAARSISLPHTQWPCHVSEVQVCLSPKGDFSNFNPLFPRGFKLKHETSSKI